MTQPWERWQRLVELRRTQRLLLRAMPDALVDGAAKRMHTPNVRMDTADRMIAEDTLRVIAAENAENLGELRARIVQWHSDEVTSEFARELRVLPTEVEKMSRRALDFTNSWSPDNEQLRMMESFVTSALAADLLADDEYRDPRLATD